MDLAIQTKSVEGTSLSLNLEKRILNFIEKESLKKKRKVRLSD